jgi:predicted RNase H-like nuclease
LPWIAGVDGCRAGWFVVLVGFGSDAGREEHRIFTSFREVLDLGPKPTIIAVDIPIGLLEEPSAGGRECDREARRLLGTPRRSSVFTPPTRPALASATYEEAQSFGAGMSHQAFGILPKIREVDQLMTPEVQETVREIHPELCFYGLTGNPMSHNKKSTEGKAERLEALQDHFSRIGRALGVFPHTQVGSDDVLDAYAAAWTALRIAENNAKRIPPRPRSTPRASGWRCGTSSLRYSAHEGETVRTYGHTGLAG